MNERCRMEVQKFEHFPVSIRVPSVPLGDIEARLLPCEHAHQFAEVPVAARWTDSACSGDGFRPPLDLFSQHSSLQRAYSSEVLASRCSVCRYDEILMC